MSAATPPLGRVSSRTTLGSKSSKRRIFEVAFRRGDGLGLEYRQADLGVSGASAAAGTPIVVESVVPGKQGAAGGVCAGDKLLGAGGRFTVSIGGSEVLTLDTLAALEREWFAGGVRGEPVAYKFARSREPLSSTSDRVRLLTETRIDVAGEGYPGGNKHFS